MTKIMTKIKNKDSIKINEPKMYNVLILNDDYTPMDIVIDIITDIFHKSLEEAQVLANNIHTKGSTVVGLYPKEIAESKANRVIEVASKAEYPLQSEIQSE